MQIKSHRTIAYVAIAAAAVIVYLPAVFCGFVAMDDADYVYLNPHVRSGLTWENVHWAFETMHMANWHPVTWLSHMIDVELYGLNPAGHHATNILLHAANTVLLLNILFKATRVFWPSVAVAALFVVHPLHVESVAWVAERKDVLSAFFMFAAIRVYLVYVRSELRAIWRVLANALVAVLFFTALMSKPMPVTLPFILLLLDIWPLQRIETGLTLASALRRAWSLVAEKVGLFLAVAWSIVMTLGAQRLGGTTHTLPDLTLAERVANAALSYTAYIGATVWPIGLSPIYPHPRSDVAYALAIAAGTALAAMSACALYRARKHGWLFTGWFWCIGMLIPAIGLVQVGYQARADRYMYLPIVGLFVIAVWLIASVIDGRPGRKFAAGVACAAVLTSYCAVTVRQIGFWRDTETMLGRALAVTDDNYFAHQQMGMYRFSQGRLEDAELHFRESLRAGPDVAALRSSLAVVLRQQGKIEEALEHAQRAAAMAPGASDARTNLGWVLRDAGDRLGAERAFERAVILNAANANAYYGLAVLQAESGRLTDAQSNLEKALQIQPDYPAARRLIDAIRVRAATTG